VHSVAKPMSKTGASQACRELAMLWGGIALLMFVARSWLFGPLATPSLRTLLGIDDGGLFGPAGPHTIRLEDPLLLILCLASAMLAVMYAVRAARQARRGASPL